MPSTIANKKVDFLSDYKHIVKENESISYLYIVYQLFLMVSTVLRPATVLLMITGAYIKNGAAVTHRNRRGFSLGSSMVEDIDENKRKLLNWQLYVINSLIWHGLRRRS